MLNQFGRSTEGLFSPHLLVFYFKVLCLTNVEEALVPTHKKIKSRNSFRLFVHFVKRFLNVKHAPVDRSSPDRRVVPGLRSFEEACAWLLQELLEVALDTIVVCVVLQIIRTTLWDRSPNDSTCPRCLLLEVSGSFSFAALQGQLWSSKSIWVGPIHLLKETLSIMVLTEFELGCLGTRPSMLLAHADVSEVHLLMLQVWFWSLCSSQLRKRIVGTLQVGHACCHVEIILHLWDLRWARMVRGICSFERLIHLQPFWLLPSLAGLQNLGVFLCKLPALRESWTLVFVLSQIQAVVLLLNRGRGFGWVTYHLSDDSRYFLNRTSFQTDVGIESVHQLLSFLGSLTELIYVLDDLFVEPPHALSFQLLQLLRSQALGLIECASLLEACVPVLLSLIEVD